MANDERGAAIVTGTGNLDAKDVVTALVDEVGVGVSGLDFHPETGGPFGVDACFAIEPEQRRGGLVVDDVDVVFVLVVPEHHGLIDLTVKPEADLAVAFAGCGRFEFGDALFQVGAAVPAKIGSRHRVRSRHGAHCSKRDGTNSALHKAPSAQMRTRIKSDHAEQ